MDAHDEATLGFYNREAEVYAQRPVQEFSPRLEPFLATLKSNAKILELGCGGGRDSAEMLKRGFDVTPTDGSTELAAQASARLGIPVRVMKFAELDAREAYDAVWANACLLHVPFAALPDVLTRVHVALKPGGLFYASYKMGEGEGRDSLGRYYNFPSAQMLEDAYRAAAAWAHYDLEIGEGGGYDGVPRQWAHVTARKAP